MTEEELIKDGWRREDTSLDSLYSKSINGFYYDLSKEDEFSYNNWYKWNLHIDTPDFCSVANIEIDSLEHIYKISEIYKA